MRATLVTNGTTFDMRYTNSTDITYTNKCTGQSYRVVAIADTWFKDGCQYVDVMVLVNGKVVVLKLNERITQLANRATSRYLFSNTNEALPLAMSWGESYVKRLQKASA